MPTPRFRDGCEFSPECGRCPLSACRYDMAPRVARHEMRLREARELESLGLSWMAIAKRLNVTTRTVSRILGGK